MTNTKADRLLPCPHCGAGLTLRGGVNSYGRHPKSDCIGARMPVVNIPDDVERWNTRAAPIDTKSDPLREALTSLVKTAQLLQKNSEGCVSMHHNLDLRNGLPGWLRDTQTSIDAANAALALPPAAPTEMDEMTTRMNTALADALESRLTRDRNGNIDASLGIKVNSKLCEEVTAAAIALRAALPPAAPLREACGCGVMCQDLGKDAGCRYLQPARETLRKLVDIVYQHATEGETFPATVTADLLIDRAFGADAILAAVPQERVDRAAVIDVDQEVRELSAILRYMEETIARQFDPAHVVTLVALMLNRFERALANAKGDGES
jgi:hypothetical protein